jgi:hypothetical protein
VADATASAAGMATAGADPDPHWHTLARTGTLPARLINIRPGPPAPRVGRCRTSPTDWSWQAGLDELSPGALHDPPPTARPQRPPRPDRETMRG